MKNIHVHLHDRNSPAGRARFNKELTARVATRDADDDGEGRWVTIMGAHVHIGKGGKIDKGPAALVNKSEHEANAHAHSEKSAEHFSVSVPKRKEGDHEGAFFHEGAARAHKTASSYFTEAHDHAAAGNIKQARKSHELAGSFQKLAGEKEAALKAHQDSKQGAAKAAPFVKPKAHENLHNEAADDVKGSEKHEAEHKRLLKLYDSSKTKWERDAVNRLISNNSTAAMQHKAMGMHNKALAASTHANSAGTDVEAHRLAMAHIDAAIKAHGQSGGVGYAKRQEELGGLRKAHAKVVSKADADAARKKPAALPPLAGADSMSDAQLAARMKKKAPTHGASRAQPGTPIDGTVKKIVKNAAEDMADQDPKKQE